MDKGPASYFLLDPICSPLPCMYQVMTIIMMTIVYACYYYPSPFENKSMPLCLGCIWHCTPLSTALPIKFYQLLIVLLAIVAIVLVLLLFSYVYYGYGTKAPGFVGYTCTHQLVNQPTNSSAAGLRGGISTWTPYCWLSDLWRGLTELRLSLSTCWVYCYCFSNSYIQLVSYNANVVLAAFRVRPLLCDCNLSTIFSITWVPAFIY